MKRLDLFSNDDFIGNLRALPTSYDSRVTHVQNYREGKALEQKIVQYKIKSEMIVVCFWQILLYRFLITELVLRILIFLTISHKKGYFDSNILAEWKQTLEIVIFDQTLILRIKLSSLENILPNDQIGPAIGNLGDEHFWLPKNNENLFKGKLSVSMMFRSKSFGTDEKLRELLVIIY